MFIGNNTVRYSILVDHCWCGFMLNGFLDITTLVYETGAVSHRMTLTDISNE